MYPSRLLDLSTTRLIEIWSVTLIIIALMLFRATFVMMRFGRTANHYPLFWTSSQIRYLQLTRSFVGVALMLTWGALLYVSPFLPWRAPFSQSNAILFIGLLVQTYAWLVMAQPFDWNQSPLAR